VSGTALERSKTSEKTDEAMAEKVTYEVTKLGDVDVVAISGRLDATTAGDVRDRIGELTQTSPVKVVVDLENLEWIDSSGVGALISLYKRARTAGGDVKVAGLQSQPKEIFRLLRLEAALEVFDDVAAAVAYLTKG
jgi:anti-sigma B factor antagonist